MPVEELSQRRIAHEGSSLVFGPVPEWSRSLGTASVQPGSEVRPWVNALGAVVSLVPEMQYRTAIGILDVDRAGLTELKLAKPAWNTRPFSWLSHSTRIRRSTPARPRRGRNDR